MLIEIKYALLSCVSCLFISCGVQQRVIVCQQPTRVYMSVAISPSEDSTSEMDSNIQQSFLKHGYVVRQNLEPHAKKSDETDIIISYVQHWYWDIVMYLREVEITLIDAKTSNVVSIGRYENNSEFHKYPKIQKVVDDLVSELSEKIKKKD